jgi:hypothetical protein
MGHFMAFLWNLLRCFERSDQAAVRIAVQERTFCFLASFSVRGLRQVARRSYCTIDEDTGDSSRRASQILTQSFIKYMLYLMDTRDSAEEKVN